jgi:hypothetical protein
MIHGPSPSCASIVPTISFAASRPAFLSCSPKPCCTTLVQRSRRSLSGTRAIFASRSLGASLSVCALKVGQMRGTTADSPWSLASLVHTRMRALPSGVVGRSRTPSNFSSRYSLISIESITGTPSSMSVGTTPFGLSATYSGVCCSNARRLRKWLV